MKTLLKLEEAAQFLACLLLLVMNGVPWWAYLLLLLGPDIGMLGYLINTRVGAVTYNFFHHKGIALLVALIALGSDLLNLAMATPQIGHVLLLGAIILFGHASMDRMFGYGLKFGDHFQHTHLGWIGRPKEQGQAQGQ
ncbi:MAG: DUF4260 domain-containing protein [Flavobacteriales bacterium]|nr:DUF4260 domain-containing protein [Flavobacteriales bacterium]